MIHIYCIRGSDSALLLRNSLREMGAKARRLRRDEFPIKKDDAIVNWGDTFPPAPAVKIFNRTIISDKLRQLTRMELRGVRVPKFGLFPQEGWLARVRNHQGGADLLSGRKEGDFYIEKLPFVKEFRVHTFKTSPQGAVSIKSGIKIPIDGPHHEWIRSYDAGWRISYGPRSIDEMRQVYRDEAKKALLALDMDFGAVDVGVLRDGTPVILEVNSAPGCDGPTAMAYATNILKVLNESDAKRQAA